MGHMSLKDWGNTLNSVARGIVSRLGSQGWEMVNYTVTVYSGPIPLSELIWFKRRVIVQGEERREVFR